MASLINRKGLTVECKDYSSCYEFFEHYHDAHLLAFALSVLKMKGAKIL